MNLLADVPDLFSGIFQFYWVFVVVIVFISIVGVAIITGIILLLVFRVFRKGGQVIDHQMELQDKMLEERECEFCGGVIQGFASECPNCGAPVKAKAK